MDLHDFAKLIRQKRIAKGMTQGRLAELLCVSTSTVCKWETRVCFPDLSLLDELSKVLEIPKSELFAYRSAKNSSVPFGTCYTGVLVKECLRDLSVLDCVEIVDVALQSFLICGQMQIHYATCIEVKTDEPDFPTILSKALAEDGCAELNKYFEKDGATFDPEHVIVFSDVFYSFRSDDYEQMAKVKEELSVRGISDVPGKDPFLMFGKRGNEKR